MNTDEIKEVSIDGTRRLRVIPLTRSFPEIFRSATEIHWDSKGGYLFSPFDPKDWTYSDWFRQILKAVREEYGCLLTLSSKTRWVAVPQDVKERMNEIAKSLE